MTKKLTKQIGEALNLLSQANNAMINAIIAAIKENEGYIDYVETCSCGNGSTYDENRIIKYNENGDLCLFDDCDNEIGLIEDMSADELYVICIKINN